MNPDGYSGQYFTKEGYQVMESSRIPDAFTKYWLIIG
jgi:hypothetical protein